jgi:signal transduction histidine kinase
VRVSPRSRWTIRLRLTLLYGGLFLLSGAALLAITYGLVVHAAGGGVKSLAAGGESTPSPHQTQPPTLRAQAADEHAAEMHALLVQSGIALGITATGSIALGWAVAGRVLRPLRAITESARQISATSLHERLALDGPADELKVLGDTFDELLARLETSFRAQRQFIANASHELRTPLARQRTLIQLALSDTDATAESLRMAHERVLVCGTQQEQLIEALLTLARGQAGLDRREPIDLAVLAEQILTARQAEAREHGLDLHTDLRPAVTAGTTRLAERLVANLVDNALRYNTAPGKVDVTTEARAGRAVLTVSNTGPVIPATAVEQLFWPFHRLGTSRTAHRNGPGHRDGLGLGLSIVQAIADAHDATLDLRPRPAGGLQVRVSFPAVRRGAGEAVTSF